MTNNGQTAIANKLDNLCQQVAISIRFVRSWAEIDPEQFKVIAAEREFTDPQFKIILEGLERAQKALTEAIEITAEFGSRPA